jgi:hypothetical protein
MGGASRRALRASRAARWRVVYDTGYARGSGPPLRLDPAILDAQGYDVVPRAAEIAPNDAVPGLARYWQAWLDDGAAPAAAPPFLAGYWTSEYGTSIAGTQDEPGSNGHPAHTVYGDRAAPPGEVWTFGVYDNLELVCSPLHQTTVRSGAARQDAARAKWGPDLAPGVYRSITAQILREPCVLVPRSGDLIAFGADRWLVGLRGER